MGSYPLIKAERKLGSEKLHEDSSETGIALLEFWQWSASDLSSNATRGLLAEFIVAKALGSRQEVRAEWDSYDVLSQDGIKVEVKSAAYIQSWHQRALSRISFGIQPTRDWNADTGQYALESKRQADVYVFALLHHQVQETIDPLNLSQWTFHVIGTGRLNSLGAQKQIALSTLLKLEPTEETFEGIAVAVGLEAAAAARAE